MMCRHLILAAVLGLAFLGSSPLAAPMLSLEGLPAAYAPGASFVFDVSLVGAEDLNLYSIDLTLAAQSGTPGVDFLFDEDLTTEPASRYVFDAPDVYPEGFFASADIDGSLATLNLSDLLGIGEMVDTVSEVNDLVATVTVTTTGDMGDLTIAFDTTFLELLDDFGDDIPGFDDLTVSSPQTVPVVPEPSSLVALLCMCAVLLAAYAWRR